MNTCGCSASARSSSACSASALSPPDGPVTTASHDAALRDLGRRRVSVDRDRHRDHKTKARQAFPAAGRGVTTRNAPAQITICAPLAA